MVSAATTLQAINSTATPWSSAQAPQSPHGCAVEAHAAQLPQLTLLQDEEACGRKSGGTCSPRPTPRPCAPHPCGLLPCTLPLPLQALQQGLYEQWEHMQRSPHVVVHILSLHRQQPLSLAQKVWCERLITVHI